VLSTECYSEFVYFCVFFAAIRPAEEELEMSEEGDQENKKRKEQQKTKTKMRYVKRLKSN